MLWGLSKVKAVTTPGPTLPPQLLPFHPKLKVHLVREQLEPFLRPASPGTGSLTGRHDPSLETLAESLAPADVLSQDPQDVPFLEP